MRGVKNKQKHLLGDAFCYILTAASFTLHVIFKEKEYMYICMQYGSIFSAMLLHNDLPLVGHRLFE